MGTRARNAAEKPELARLISAKKKSTVESRFVGIIITLEGPMP
jgi:hypothetical protein